MKSSVDSTTTHLVAARLGTAKVKSINYFKSKFKNGNYFQVNDARKFSGNIHIVTPDWLWSCSERWERVSGDQTEASL